MKKFVAVLLVSFLVIAADSAFAKMVNVDADGNMTLDGSGIEVIKRGATASGHVDRGTTLPHSNYKDVTDVCPRNNTGFTERIVRCIEGATNAAASKLLRIVFTYTRDATVAFSIVALAFFGVALMMGAVEKVGPSSIMFVVKFGLLLTFMANAMDFFLAVMNTIKQTMAWATTLIDTSPSFSCPTPTAIDDKTLWQRVDCVFGSILGAAPGVVLQMGLIGVLFGFLFSGATGFMIFVIGVIFLMTLLLSIVRAVQIYLVSYLGVAFLMTVSPMFVPMVLTSKTRPFFDKWLKLVISLAIQPIFLFMYLGMALVTFDNLVYKSANSFYGIIAGTDMRCHQTRNCHRISSAVPTDLLPPAPAIFRVAAPNAYACDPAALPPADRGKFCLLAWMRAKLVLTNELRLGMLIDLKPASSGPTAAAPKAETGLWGSIWADFKTKMSDAYNGLTSALLETAGNLSLRLPITIVDMDRIRRHRRDGTLVWSGTTYDYTWERLPAPPRRPVVPSTYTGALPIPDYVRNNVNLSNNSKYNWSISYHLMMQTFLCALMGYVMYAILKYIPDLSHSMVGSIFNSPNLYRVSPLPFEQKAGQVMHNIGMQFMEPEPKPTSSRRR